MVSAFMDNPMSLPPKFAGARTCAWPTIRTRSTTSEKAERVCRSPLEVPSWVDDTPDNNDIRVLLPQVQQVKGQEFNMFLRLPAQSLREAVDSGVPGATLQFKLSCEDVHIEDSGSDFFASSA